ncbi:PDR/VanB family oxidoreductase [Pseudomonas citronellolis]|uniref:PDR/VanB family oxidoreductase n=1 Tax=Pseudomonas citronellolis TaxID=53408 RepID=UPI000852C0D8|nr:PDR/VanB family oxidoreductase [Pseudomonas humi]
MVSSSDNDIQPLEVVVSRVTSLTAGIKEFELVPSAGQDSLPAASPGSHIKIRIGNGHWRAYSVVNFDNTERYVIAVRLCPGFSEGSQFMHDFVDEGDVLSILPPENGFALAEQAERSILIAGGIGITPLIALGRRMKALGMNLAFHYLGRREDDMAYVAEVREAFGADAHLYFTDDQGVPALSELIGAYRTDTHLYACGPESMLLAVRQESANWPADSVHFELFINSPDSPASIAQPAYAFEVRLARSGQVLQVPADKTILEVLREVGIELPSVCRAGFCGSCVVPLLEGEADHRDTVLTDAERKNRIQTCCSRAPEGMQLVIDR